MCCVAGGVALSGFNDHLKYIGGADKNAVVFQKDTEQIVATLRGHTKKVTGVVYHPREVSVVSMITAP